MLFGVLHVFFGVVAVSCSTFTRSPASSRSRALHRRGPVLVGCAATEVALDGEMKTKKNMPKERTTEGLIMSWLVQPATAGDSTSAWYSV